MNRKPKDNTLLLAYLVLFLIIAVAAQAQGSSLSGFVDLSASWNSNAPESRENFYPGAGTTAKRANELSLNLVQLQWTRPVSAEQPVGFTLAAVAGEGTEIVHAAEPGGPQTFRHVYQASLAYRLPNGLVLEGGVYPSHIGMEGFYSKDNWNYTRSILGETSPYYQTGIKAAYPFNDHWSGQIHLLNGWQLIRDNNNAKALGTQLAYSSGPLSASLNTFLGAEAPGDDDSLRRFADLVVLYKLNPSLQLGATADAGAQDLPGGGEAQWFGAGIYGRWSLDERNALAVRLERFHDPDNGITGFAQKIGEVTVTWETRPHSNLILKLEGRYDQSDADVFADGDGFSEQQLLAIAGLVVTF